MSSELPIAVSLCRARAAKIAIISRVRELASVQGAGITDNGTGYAVQINLREMPDNEHMLPKTTDGVSIIYNVVGDVKAFSPVR